MIRSLVLVVLSAMLLGTTCLGDSGLTCANALDASEFGFTLTVPSGFQCASVFPNAQTLGQSRYIDIATGVIVSVQINVPSEQSDDPGEGVTLEELGATTNDAGVSFDLVKVTFTDGDPPQTVLVSYAAGATLQSGNNLMISVVALSDDAGLRTTLDSIIASVQLSE